MATVCANPTCPGRTPEVIRAKGLCKSCYWHFWRHGTHVRKRARGEKRDVSVRGGKQLVYVKRGEAIGRTYACWAGVLERIRNPKQHNLRRYYAGLTVDPRWYDFEVFLADMGVRPAGMSIDRIDNAKGYWPDNCRWADRTTQMRNRSCTKLSMEKAEQIRLKYARGVTLTRLGCEYEVGASHIQAVVRNEIWKA